MNPEQIHLVQTTFAVIEQNPDAVSQHFYLRMFQIEPSLKAIFKDDLGSQSRKFMAMLKLVVKGLSRYEQLGPALQALGSRHVIYGCQAWQYEPMKKALLWAFEQELEESYTPEVAEAWQAAYDMLAKTMLASYPQSAR